MGTAETEPLTRFIAIEEAIVPKRTMFCDGKVLRASCLGLIRAPGSPEQLASQFHQTAAELRRGAGWFGSLNSEVRFAVAASLVRRGQSAGAFAVELDRVQAMFREERLPRGGSLEVLAILLLSGSQENLATPRGSVERLALFYRAMKSRKRLLTGTDDYPACALLCSEPGREVEVLDRVDALYEGLKARGLRRGNALQRTSHLLHFSTQPDGPVLDRFSDLFGCFRHAGLRMGERDYGLVATLCFLAMEAERVVDTVLGQRRTLLETSGARGKQEGFELATSTAFQTLTLEADRTQGALAGWTPDIPRLLMVTNMLAAQEAAMVAAAASTVLVVTH